MQAAHKVGWMNVDVKPDNMLLGPGPDNVNVYMVDWGCALNYLTAGGSFQEPGNKGGNDLYRSLAAHDLERTCCYSAATVLPQCCHSAATALPQCSSCVCAFVCVCGEWGGGGDGARASPPLLPRCLPPPTHGNPSVCMLYA
jgi:hypothetical protein